MNEVTIPRRNTPGDTAAAVVAIDQFHPASKQLRPHVTCWLTHDDLSLSLRFDVRGDRCVRGKYTQLQDPVFLDSCVEFFVQPTAGSYFNFEWNCIGTMLLTHVRDWTRVGEGLAHAVPLMAGDLAGLEITTSIQSPIVEEIPGPLDWWLTATIPVSIFEPFVGPLPDLSGQTWRANFNCCAQGVSSPYYGSWASIGEPLNFHQPERFGRLTFE